MFSRNFLLGFFAAAILFSFSQTAAQEERVDFRRTILPILSDHCLQCHGVDPETRASGLRLDVREAALMGGDSGMPLLVPGDATAGELLDRIFSEDPGVVMPPPEMQRPLTDEQKKLLRQWIAQGAEYAEHWAFIKPEQTEIPTAAWPHAPNHESTIDNVSHPIDSWVAAKLNQNNLKSAPAANSTTLARRLYLDLIGLPPTPTELERFHEIGYEATVDELLARPQFGQKWARHWLDVARYSDTNGYEKDMRREQWIWRDWVIDAFNRDQPYDQFIIEQVAGDLLPNATQDQMIATGFFRNSMVNEEGAIVPEEFRMAEMFDRLDCLGKVVLGLTTQCAQCHTHKFDPLTHEEYFGMFAFLNNSYEAQSWVYSAEQEQKRQQVLRDIEAVHAQIREQRPDWLKEWSDWVAELQAKKTSWTPVTMDDLGSVSGLNHPVQLSDQSILMLGHTSGDVYYLTSPELNGITGLRLEILTHGDLPFLGPGRGSAGTWGVQELEVFSRQLDQEWQKEPLANASADWSQPEQSHQEGKQKSGPVEFLIDGSDANWWQADRGIGRRNQSSVAVVQFSNPLQYPIGTQLKIVLRMNSMVGCCRVSLTTEPNPRAVPVPYAAQQLVAAIEDAADHEHLWATLSNEQQNTLFAAWLKTVPELSEQNQEIHQLWSQYPHALTSVLHLSERPADSARSTYLLDRGQWNLPQHVVQPHTPAFLPDMESLPDSEASRLRFAKWLVSPDSPLAARVAVNRVWQSIFGQGLVETPEDFGTRAPVPEHLELLDWLAVEFMRQGWSHKQLIRRIVTSRTYQQDSRVAAEQWEGDPDNRWLARGPRFRADAEVVRDIALAASGLLVSKEGGPSVIPPVPQNVLDYNYVYPSYWTAATGEDRYRRTIYGFRKRSMPDPATNNFDAPNGDLACVRRVRSNTPLAALTGLNETIFVEAARAMSLRVLREAEPAEEQRVSYAFQLCTSRQPNEDELKLLLNVLQQQRQRLADGWLDPRVIATGEHRVAELPAGCTPQDAAAWMMVCRIMLNLDETISKN